VNAVVRGNSAAVVPLPLRSSITRVPRAQVSPPSLNLPRSPSISLDLLLNARQRSATLGNARQRSATLALPIYLRSRRSQPLGSPSGLEVPVVTRAPGRHNNVRLAERRPSRDHSRPALSALLEVPRYVEARSSIGTRGRAPGATATPSAGADTRWRSAGGT
jgi:hypothetical protein